MLALAACGPLLLLALHPHIGVRDGDAVGYLTGAMSLQAGHGYTDLSGAALNHWPPGYSWLLSLWSRPLVGSQVLNYGALGVATSALFWNARMSGWTPAAALAMSLSLGFGFFRGLANNAAPDIIVYAAFLTILPLYRRAGRLWWLPYVIWTSLILLKLIAAIFVPAALAAGWWSGERLGGGRIGGVLGLWAIVLVGLAAFNCGTIGQLLPASYEPASLRALANAVKLMVVGIPRQGLAFWYGSIRSWTVFVPVAAVAVCGLWCYGSLAPPEPMSRAVALGIALLILSVALQCVRQYSGGWRLTGYGFLAIAVAMRSRPATSRRWLAYAAASVALACVNAASVNAMGANDPRYVALAAQVAPSISEPGLATNSYHLLDIHQRLATTPVSALYEVKGRGFLWVDLPSYDAVATVVSQMDRPSSGWCEAVSFRGATLFHRCGEVQ